MNFANSKNILWVSSFVLTGCSSIMDGSSQQITVKTTPPGAACQLIRAGEVIASIPETPGGVAVKKTKEDIVVMCKKDGHEETSHTLKSGIQGSVFGNILAGGVIGWAVDSASGADNKYDDVVDIALVPKGYSSIGPEKRMVSPVSTIRK